MVTLEYLGFAAPLTDWRGMRLWIGSLAIGTGEGMIYIYTGKQKQQYFSDLLQVEGGTISPGGAAQMLGVTRQRASQLPESQEIRAWAYYPEFSRHAALLEISVRDILAYGIRIGRFKEFTDVGLGFPALQEEFERLKGNDIIGE